MPINLFNLANGILPATGRAPRPLQFIQFPLPSRITPGELLLSPTQPDRTPRFDNAQQGPSKSPDIPVDISIATAAAIRAATTRAQFIALSKVFLKYTIGKPNPFNAYLYAAGWVFDPVRYAWQRGTRVLVPGPPVRPPEGILTPEFNAQIKDTGQFLNRAIDRSLLGPPLEAVGDAQRAIRRRLLEDLRASSSHSPGGVPASGLGALAGAIEPDTLAKLSGEAAQPGGPLDVWLEQILAAQWFSGNAVLGPGPGERGDP